MKLLADLHTHSKYSRFFHGKNTIEEMVIFANEIGLDEIAITDHGYKHFCGTNIFNLDKARDEIDEINKWSKTRVLLGVEADIIAEDGTLDIDEDTLGLIDILIVGYHRLIKTNFAGFFGCQKKNKDNIKKATNAYINAINRYPVTIISHLDSILKTNLYEIGKACADKGVMVEINNRHCKWNSNQVKQLVDSGCMFIVSSDAHKREDIGSISNAINIIEKYNIPKSFVANVDFGDYEKSQDELEVQTYYSLYKMNERAKQEKKRLLEEKIKTEFTNQLSPEIEKELKKIAEEKGYEYQNQEDINNELIEEYHKYKAIFKETEELINKAKDYLISQNNIEESTEEINLDELNLDIQEDVLKDEKISDVVEEKSEAKEKTEDEKVIDILMKAPTKSSNNKSSKSKLIESSILKKGNPVIVKNQTTKTNGKQLRNKKNSENNKKISDKVVSKNKKASNKTDK